MEQVVLSDGRAVAYEPDHTAKRTNSRCLPSDCYNCRRAEGGYCWIGRSSRKHLLSEAAEEYDLCAYWYPVVPV